MMCTHIAPREHVLQLREELERHYEDRANVDFLEIPESGVLVLRYRVHRPLVISENQVNWQWTVTGFD